MPINPVTVRPGDIISAQFVNALIQQLIALEQRISDLESATSTPGTPSITLDPITGSVRIGEPVTLNGSGFTSDVMVTVAGVPVTQFGLIRTTARMTIYIPPIASVPEAGVNVTVVVSRDSDSAQRSLHVLPADNRAFGTVVVNLERPEVLTAGGSAVFPFTIQSAVDADVTYLIEPRIAAGWPHQLVAQPSGSVLTGGILAIPARAERRVDLIISPPSGATGTSTLEVVVRENRTDSLVQPGSSGIIELTIGEESVPGVVSVSVVNTGGLSPGTVGYQLMRAARVSVSVDANPQVLAGATIASMQFSLELVQGVSVARIDGGPVPRNTFLPNQQVAFDISPAGASGVAEVRFTATVLLNDGSNNQVVRPIHFSA